MRRSPRNGDAECSAATLMVEDDVREQLLPPQERTDQAADDDDSFTHEELLHSIGSFSAVVWPVTVTMLLASVVSLNVVDPATAAALAKYALILRIYAILQQLTIVLVVPYSTYLIYGPGSDAGASTETKFGEAMINALAIVSFFLVATFTIVCCYKFNMTKLLIGYMMFSSAMLLGMLGGNILRIVIARLQVPVDIVSMMFAMFNFSVVGVIAIFYQKGISTGVAQLYLVITSVIMAWQLGQFPEWSTWALVVVLAFYDLCAVLTPCGPLKWLVHLVQQEGRPLPGLLYEAEIKRDHSGSTEANQQPASPPLANIYYQCEEEIPLRLGSPREHQVVVKSTPSVSPASQGTGTAEREKILRERLVQFYTHYNPSAIARLDKIIDQYRGREAQLWHDLHQKYLAEGEEEDSTIKLGLGDFVFYSVLVSRATMYDFSAMIGCLVSILMGLGGTLFLLGIYKKALPALPISILLAVVVNFWIRGVFVDYINHNVII